MVRVLPALYGYYTSRPFFPSTDKYMHIMRAPRVSTLVHPLLVCVLEECSAVHTANIVYLLACYTNNNTHEATIVLLPSTTHRQSHTYMYTQANPYHQLLPLLRNITYHPFAPQLQSAANPQLLSIGPAIA